MGTGINDNYELGIEDGEGTGINCAFQLGIKDVNKKRNEFTLILKNESIRMVDSSSSHLIPFIWSIEEHIYFSSSFKESILTFYLSLKRIQFKTSLKIPKFVIFEIIKQTI